MLQAQLPLYPEDAQVISSKLALVRFDGDFIFYHGVDPIYVISEDDPLGIRIGLGLLTHMGLASPTALAKAFDLSPSTVFRHRKKMREGGIDAFVQRKRPGPRGPSKLKSEVASQVQQLLDNGFSRRAAASKLGLSEGGIRNAIDRGLLKAERPQKRSLKSESREELKRPSERAAEDVLSPAGIGVKRHDERFSASLGQLREALPRFVPAEAVNMAGALLALPAILDTGLLAVGEKVFGQLKNGFYGLRSVLLTLVFMAIVRVKTVEKLSSHAPGELGFLVGLDRVPEVKTVRRKLREMGVRGQAWKFATELTRRWAKESPESMEFLYVDGHVRVHTGRKHKLPKTHVPRRRLCMPATTDMWVNDINAEPLLFVTAEANDGLLSMMNEEILPQIRRLAGKERRITLVFDREGWSPENFHQWHEKKFDVLTYRKGKYEAWPENCFMDKKVKVSGKDVTYKLGERSIRILDEKKDRKGNVKRKEFWVREVRRLCDNKHQTSVITTRQDISITDVAVRMFSRWRQENFFRYMRHEFNLDHTPTYTVEQADPERLVPNPRIKQKRKELAKLKGELSKLERDYGEKAMNNDESRCRTMRGFKIAEAETSKKIRRLHKSIKLLNATIKQLPNKVPVKEIVGSAEGVVRLEQERKVITDAVKLAGYRAETALLNVLEPFLNRHREEGRDFLKTVFRASADIIPDDEKGQLVVRYYPLPNPRENRALSALCDVMTARKTIYPGTKLRLVFHGPEVQPFIARGQEF